MTPRWLAPTANGARTGGGALSSPPRAHSAHPPTCWWARCSDQQGGVQPHPACLCRSKERFDEIETKLTPFLRSCGYNPKKDLVYLPISGLFGHNMKDRVDKSKCDWYHVRMAGGGGEDT